MRCSETMYGKCSTREHNAGNNPFFQPKMNVSQPHDPLELEADSMAERVMQASTKQNHFFSGVSGSLHRKVEKSDSESNLQIKRATGVQAETMTSSVVPEAISSGGQPLDSETRNYFEPRFGHDLGNVRIHTGSLASQSSSDIDALAYTQGNHIVFGEGQFRPDTYTGKQLLAHELTHTLQQKNNTIFRQPRNFTGKVSNKKDDSFYSFQSVYHLNITDNEAVITINMKLIPDQGISKQQVEDVKFQTKTEFLRYWDNRFTLTDPDGNKIPLRMKLNFVEDGADLEVHLHAGNSFKRTVENGTVTITNETEDLENWYAESPASARAHELGHQLGMLDEYVDPASVNREKEDSPGVFDKDHSLMNNPDDEGRADVRLRHGNTLAADITNATGTTYKAGWSNTYIVNHGDTMKKIALRIYGDENKWRDIYELNKKNIDNYTLRFGQVIVLPPIP